MIGASCATAGMPLAGVRIVDGSGLSLDDRVTARALAALLVSFWNDPALRATVWARAAGRGRERDARAPAADAHRRAASCARRPARPNNASALSGYVGARYAFAVLQNGSPVAYWPAHKAEDRFVDARSPSGPRVR